MFRLIPTLTFLFCLCFTAIADNFTQIDWIDLLPADDLAALENPPAYLDDIEDGSLEDQLANSMVGALEQSTKADDPYQQALVSQNVVADFDNRDIRLPGFIVPVNMDAEQRATEFFLVPYFGACIHLPPPPPNQIIYVYHEAGIQIDEIYTPYWVEGRLSTTLTENDLAVSAYAMQAENITIYTEEK
ncbi:hypothetical protein Q7C_2493 [Methylophaga frappieri]|uniref:Lipoprotein n=1 Tax=Methylophaga frappieri (strain ATCC BAA-2434 / DSM 25690 / JAM7) TaxID=754477 RepID=I1YL25_METFJ|nr:DUF3299 domain-containing protein [Methylophaga frappieri]AFJ03618.1 hypothetical protein Q7C_2493 [Methylophaga frappieri]